MGFSTCAGLVKDDIYIYIWKVICDQSWPIDIGSNSLSNRVVPFSDIPLKVAWSEKSHVDYFPDHLSRLP